MPILTSGVRFMRCADCLHYLTNAFLNVMVFSQRPQHGPRGLPFSRCYQRSISKKPSIYCKMKPMVFVNA